MSAVIKTYAEIVIGDKAEFEIPITTSLVDQFANLSGDQNPLHVDEVFAEKTSFGERIAHGMLAGAFFSRLIGMHLPGTHSLYLSQSLFFRKPMRIGITVMISGEVRHKGDALQILTMAMQVRDKNTGEVLTDGEAIVQIL